MTILKNIFKRADKVEQATGERTEAELELQLAEIEIAIASGEGDIVANLEEKESLKLQIQAAHIARQKREDAAYRARVTDQANELRGRLNESLDELGDLVPRLLLACSHFNRMAAEVQEKGLGFDGGGLLEDHFGIPPDFGSRLTAAIKEMSPRTEWDYSHIGPLAKGKKAERPKLKGPLTLRVPHFHTSPPPGYSGGWDVLRGQPMDLIP